MRSITEPVMNLFSSIKETDVSDRKSRIKLFARIMDTAVGVPFTKIRFGLDALLSAIPIVGPWTGTLLSTYLFVEAWNMKVPLDVFAKMLGNLGLDALLSSIPFIGFFFDVSFKANVRNASLLLEFLERQRSTVTVNAVPA